MCGFAHYDICNIIFRQKNATEIDFGDCVHNADLPTHWYKEYQRDQEEIELTDEELYESCLPEMSGHCVSNGPGDEQSGSTP